MKTDLYFGLDGKMIANPKLFCNLKGCFLTKKDIKEKKCDEKNCKYRVVKHNWREEHYRRNFRYMNKKEAQLYGRK